jgi:hypothetical protein
MTVLYCLDSDGSFLVGDTRTGRTAYAYPSSHNAVAARHDPLRTAAMMLSGENSFSKLWRDVESFTRIDQQRMSELRPKLRGEAAAGEGPKL